MKDDLELVMTYRNDFVEWLKEIEIKATNIQELGVAHGDQVLYAIFIYTNTDTNKKEWGVWGGIDYTSPNQCPITIAGRETDREHNYDILDDAREELYRDWDIPVKEFLL